MDELKLVGLVGLVGFLLFLFFAIVLISNANYYDLIASEKANVYCRNQGFDQYSSYNKAFFSTEPKGIKCEYVEKYTDLGVRTTST